MYAALSHQQIACFNHSNLVSLDIEQIANLFITASKFPAAAFQLSRGTEAVLRLFYCSLIHNKRVSPLLWGDMVRDFRLCTDSDQHNPKSCGEKFVSKYPLPPLPC